MKNLNKYSLLVLLGTVSSFSHAQVLVNRNGDTTLYKQMDPIQKTFYDLSFGNKPDLTALDTSEVIFEIIQHKKDIVSYKLPVYMKNHLKHFDPLDNNLSSLNGMKQYDYSHCEKLIERTRPFVRMFYTCYLAFPNELKDSIEGVYIKIEVEKGKFRYFTDDFSNNDEKIDSRYIHNSEVSAKYRKKMLKLYASWSRKVRKLGLTEIRKRNIKPFDHSVFKWGFDIIPEDPFDDMK
ncbi:MAG: hypothetical protein JST26_11765 [Bacteroidetes bacterium]|nr:hypothetical protein [Bacteroidota bacterium]